MLAQNREKLHQVACLRLYELVHPENSGDNVGNHPNSYFNSSVAALREASKAEKKDGAGKKD